MGKHVDYGEIGFTSGMMMDTTGRHVISRRLVAHQKLVGIAPTRTKHGVAVWFCTFLECCIVEVSLNFGIRWPVLAFELVSLINSSALSCSLGLFIESDGQQSVSSQKPTF